MYPLQNPRSAQIKQLSIPPFLPVKSAGVYWACAFSRMGFFGPLDIKLTSIK